MDERLDWNSLKDTWTEPALPNDLDHRAVNASIARGVGHTDTRGLPCSLHNKLDREAARPPFRKEVRCRTPERVVHLLPIEENGRAFQMQLRFGLDGIGRYAREFLRGYTVRRSTRPNQGSEQQ